MFLTRDEANRICEGAVAEAQRLGITINVAVCDAGGILMAFQRMDGAMWAGAYGSQGKAIASAAFGKPSGELTERSAHPTFQGIKADSGGRMIFGQGAVDIRRGDGTLVGACGVGGGTAQEDEDCARAGIACL